MSIIFKHLWKHKIFYSSIAIISSSYYIEYKIDFFIIRSKRRFLTSKELGDKLYVRPKELGPYCDFPFLHKLLGYFLII